MQIMVSKSHTMILGRSTNKISQIVGTSFSPKQKINLPSFILQQLNLEVTDISWTITGTVDLPLLSSVSESNDDMAYKLSFSQYCFVKHLKSTTLYFSIHCPMSQHYHPLEADTPPFIRKKNIWKILNFVVNNMFKK